MLLPVAVLQDVTADYHLGKVLGRGQFGTTRVAEHKDKQRTFACKSIAKRKLTCVLCSQLSNCLLPGRPGFARVIRNQGSGSVRRLLRQLLLRRGAAGPACWPSAPLQLPRGH